MRAIVIKFKMKLFPKVTVTLSLLLLVAEVVRAQPPPPDGVPLDPLSWLVLGAGGAIAGKKLYDKKFGKKD